MAAAADMSQEKIDEDVSESNLLTPRSSDLRHEEQEEYSVLVHIQYPYQPSMGALRIISHPSRQGLLQVILQILAERGISKPMWSIQSLSIKQGNSAYV